METEIIYLVSASPRRRELLRQIGVHFETLQLRSGTGRDMDVDETVLPGEAVETYVRRVAVAKAMAGLRCIRDRRLAVHPVVTADTAVHLSGKIFGKPGNIENAVAMLENLSGCEHEVLTAVACAYGDELEVLISSSSVRFSKLTHREILDYAATGEPMDKAGAYAIQGRAARYIERIEGSYSGVMGLPLFETAQLLGKMGRS